MLLCFTFMDSVVSYNLQLGSITSLQLFTLTFLQDFTFSAASCILFLVMAFVEAYYATGAWANNCNDIGGDGIIHNGCRTIFEWAFASVSQLIQTAAAK